MKAAAPEGTVDVIVIGMGWPARQLPRAIAVAVHGQVPVERPRHMIYAYPTFHRGIEDAIRTLDA